MAALQAQGGLILMGASLVMRSVDVVIESCSLLYAN